MKDDSPYQALEEEQFSKGCMAGFCLGGGVGFVLGFAVCGVIIFSRLPAYCV